ncbi:MAG: 30S ribosomal protein S9 [Patescibacteria group bacterium]
MAKKEQRYIETIGRRKTASARVRITPSAKLDVTVNGKDLIVYFPTDELRGIVKDAFDAAETGSKYKVTVRVAGGGVHAQAEAVRHGIARALVAEDEDLRKKIKKAGFLKRDPRAKERKKPGLKKARRAPQWAKR